MAAFMGWERAVLRGIGAPVTPSNIKFLRAWQRAEGGTAAYNPLNTTQSAPGAGSYNSVGVRDFRSRQQGLNATIKTLLNGRYGPIIQGLKQSADPAHLAAAVGSSPWGTSGETISKVLGSPLPATMPKTGKTMVAPGAVSDVPGGIPTAPGADPQRQTALLSLQHLASGDYDPTKALADLLAAGRAQQPVQHLPSPKAPGVSIEAPPTIRGHRAAALVRQYLGTPYVWGGSKPGGFDCSGLVQYVYAKMGVRVPRTTYEQFKAGRPVPLGRLRAGDVLFFHESPRGPEHEGLYIGGGQFIHAPHTGDVVKVSNLKGYGGYIGARRFTRR